MPPHDPHAQSWEHVPVPSPPRGAKDLFSAPPHSSPGTPTDPLESCPYQPDVKASTPAQRPKRPASPCTRLPIIDLASPDAAAQLLSSCSTLGFQGVVNHGFEEEVSRAVRLLEATFATSSKAQMNSWRKPNLGYGPGLQQPKQMANEHYSTLQGNYNACTREDFIFVTNNFN